MQFLSELSSDFENIEFIMLPNGINSRTDLGEGLCPFAEGFWALHYCLAEMQDTEVPLYYVCVRMQNA